MSIYENVWKMVNWYCLNIVLGCSGGDDDASIIEDCSWIKDAKILAEGEGCCAVFQQFSV